MAVKKGLAVSGPWRVLVGLNYPPNNLRAEVGDIVTDIPSAEAARLAAEGIIEQSGPNIEETV